MTTQCAQITRVHSAISDHVKQFCKTRLAQNDRHFYAFELVEYVNKRVKTAPSSPTRILQDLRVQGEIAYELISRKGSLYRIDKVCG